VKCPGHRKQQPCYNLPQKRGIQVSYVTFPEIIFHAIFVLFSGVIFDGEELHYLERGSTDEGGGGNDDEGGGNGIAALHFLYRHADMKINQTCGEEATFKYLILILSVSSFFNCYMSYSRFCNFFCLFT
jgi:hypothetical protein